jgi:uncharacterized protein
MPLFSRIIENSVIKSPWFTILFSLALVISFGRFIPDFRLDASADTLVLENDKSLQYYRSIKARYGSDDALIVTYTSKSELFSQAEIQTLSKLQTALSGVDGIDSIISILNVPLLASPKTTLDELQNEQITLTSSMADKHLAKKEFLASPIYKDLLLSADGKTTAMQLNIKHDSTYYDLLNKRDSLRELQLNSSLTPSQESELASLSTEFYHYSANLQAKQKKMIADVREILDNHREHAQLFLGGVPMITADSIEFIAHDLNFFGIAVLIFLIILLVLAFQKLRWVLLPLITCFSAGAVMLGLLAILDWPVTVVSANFISLMLIITLSLTIHLIVRYRELHEENPNAEQNWLVFTTLKKKVLPCLYTAITTMVAFGSLIVSAIRPVIDFGWMMTIGVAVAFVFSFTLFPAMLVLLKPGTPANRKNLTGKVTQTLSKQVAGSPRLILTSYILLAVLSVIGMSQLTVENRFIDYYKDDTEIYQGMELIDNKLGGTTPLDIIIDAPASFFEDSEEALDPEMLAEMGMDAEDFYEEENQAGITGNSYWFNVDKLAQIKAMHAYLEALPETGKILSISSTISMLEPLSPTVANDNFYLAILYNKLPESIKNTVVSPYLSEDGNQIRFSIRVFESDHSLKRSALISKIKTDLSNKFEINQEQIKLTGMLVLYNNMLQSLFESQIMTLGFVFFVILLMFIVLFKNFKLALIALIPNIIAAALVLGVMGLLSIPLDLMTITIAAICIGIAVDDSIHYVHRFKNEYKLDNDYWLSIHRSHNSIGRAMFYTSLTIMLGFSILVFSNFVPTMYFGLLTGFSMMIALIANLSLLPVLLVKFKPLSD